MNINIKYERTFAWKKDNINRSHREIDLCELCRERYPIVLKYGVTVTRDLRKRSKPSSSRRKPIRTRPLDETVRMAVCSLILSSLR